MKCTLRQGNRLCACPMRRLVTATFLLLLLLPAAHAVASFEDQAVDSAVAEVQGGGKTREARAHDHHLG